MRGYQRKVIHIKNTGSYLFDEAYFVLSRDGEDLHIGEEDMVTEANRIIEEKNYVRLKNNVFSRYKRQIICLLIGIMAGAVPTLILSLLIK